MKQKLFTFFFALVASVSAIYASDIEVDGIWYDFNDSDLTATVTYRGSSQYHYSDEYSGTVVIPSSVTYNGTTYSVTSIGDDAFYYCFSLTSVTIGESVTSIGKSAFYYCFSLTSVTIGESVTSIGKSAFEGCSSLTSVTIGESVTSIGEWAFSGCSSLTSINVDANNANYCSIDGVLFSKDKTTLIQYPIGNTRSEYIIPNSVTSIGVGAFSGCSSLTSITIGNSVTSIGVGAFSGCSSLTSITIPNSVTSIGEYTFRGCSSLTSITIPNSVTSIGEYTFRGCSSLTSVTIGESVTSIGDGAFEGCSSLTSITIPNSVTSIGDGAFEGCDGLTSPVYNAHCFAYMPTSFVGTYTIPEGIKQIAGEAFASCDSLTSVTIPNSVTSIGGSAFFRCSSLTSITIPNSVTSIGDGAFYDCSSLTSITIPNSVTSIGNRAFYGCSSLTSITCEAVTPPTIGGTYTFDGVSKSIPVYVPCECVEAYKAASGWSDFTNIQEPLAEYSIEVYVNDTIMGTAIVNYNTFCEGAQISATPNFGYYFVQWSDGNTENPRTLELTQNTTLTAEFAQSFSGQCGDSLYWELVDTTLHITGKGEMYDCKPDSAPWKLLVSSIKVLTIAEDVTKLSQSFDSCSVLESIVWNAKHAADAYSDGQYVYPIFYGIRSQITSFTFGEAVEYIPTYLCVGMDKLTSMIIPNSVTSIGEGAFYICSSLTSVTIPNSVTSIGKSAFRDCSSLTSVHITDLAAWCNIDFVDYRANPLSSAHNLYLNGELVKDLVIPNSVTSIGEYAFYDCSSLTSVTIGNSVTSIGEDAFRVCNNITSVTWNAKNCNTYNFGSQVTSFEFGNEVEVVPSSLCEGMEKLTSVTIPNSVKTIGSSAFEGCARLGKISLGTGLEEIAANAFAGCTRLYDIYVYTTYPPFAEESSFANYNVYVYVPCEYQRGYTLDVVWGKFKFIECIESEDATTDGNVTVVPGFNDVTITWPTAKNADSYSLVIKKADEPVCTLTFNQDGQLLNIAFAPGRDGNHPAQYAAQTVSGYRFTVTGLTEATQYVYNITTKDADNNTIATYSGEFTTMGGSTSAVEDIVQKTTNVQKLLRNGQLIIVRDGVEYNAMGQEL